MSLRRLGNPRGMRCAPHLGGVDEFISEALSDRLDVAEGRLAGAGAQQPDGLVDAAQGRHVHGLTAHCARAPDTGRVLARAAVDDSVHYHLQRVLQCENKHCVKMCRNTH